MWPPSTGCSPTRSRSSSRSDDGRRAGTTPGRPARPTWAGRGPFREDTTTWTTARTGKTTSRTTTLPSRPSRPDRPPAGSGSSAPRRPARAPRTPQSSRGRHHARTRDPRPRCGSSRNRRRAATVESPADRRSPTGRAAPLDRTPHRSGPGRPGPRRRRRGLGPGIAAQLARRGRRLGGPRRAVRAGVVRRREVALGRSTRPTAPIRPPSLGVDLDAVRVRPASPVRRPTPEPTTDRPMTIPGGRGVARTPPGRRRPPCRPVRSHRRPSPGGSPPGPSASAGVLARAAVAGRSSGASTAVPAGRGTGRVGPHCRRVRWPLVDRRGAPPPAAVGRPGGSGPAERAVSDPDEGQAGRGRRRRRPATGRRTPRRIRHRRSRGRPRSGGLAGWPLPTGRPSGSDAAESRPGVRRGPRRRGQPRSRRVAAAGDAAPADVRGPAPPRPAASGPKRRGGPPPGAAGARRRDRRAGRRQLIGCGSGRASPWPSSPCWPSSRERSHRWC